MLTQHSLLLVILKKLGAIMAQTRRTELDKLGRYREDADNYYITQRQFDSILDYTRSQPTAPSPGRVYKKNLGWLPQHHDNWFMYICRRAWDDPKAVDHFGKKVRIVVFDDSGGMLLDGIPFSLTPPEETPVMVEIDIVDLKNVLDLLYERGITVGSNSTANNLSKAYFLARMETV